MSNRRSFQPRTTLVAMHSPVLTARVLPFYEAFNADSEIPLIAPRDWALDRPLPLSRMKLAWDAAARDDNVMAALAEAYGRDNPGRQLDDLDCFRLLKIERSNGQFLLHFGETSYFRFFGWTRALIDEVKAALSGADTPLGVMLPLRGRPQLAFDLTRRSAVLGVNCILLVVGEPDGDAFYLHRRSSTAVAEAAGAVHILPSGTFQPRVSDGAFEDFDLQDFVLRELFEELFDEDASHLAALLGDRHPNDSDATELLAELALRTLNMFCLAIGLDPLTLKPELVATLVFDVSGLGQAGRHIFRSNHEGYLFRVPLSDDNLLRWSRHDGVIPAGRTALALTRRHLSSLLNAKRGKLHGTR